MVAGAASRYCFDHTSFGGIVIPTLGWAETMVLEKNLIVENVLQGGDVARVEHG